MSHDYVADANLLIALLDTKNATHETSVDLLAAIHPDRMIYVHPLNLAEVLSFYPTSIEREQKWAALQEMARFAVVAVGDSAHEEAMDLAEIRHATKAQMPDVCALYTAHALRAVAVLSHDQRLAKKASRIGIRVVPGDAGALVDAPYEPHGHTVDGRIH